MRSLLSAALLSVSTVALAQSLPGNVSSGSNLALRICSDCHVVAETQRRPATDGAPPFAAVANRPGTTPLSLQVFLRTPHRSMPNLILTPAETDDIVAYILSLKR